MEAMLVAAVQMPIARAWAAPRNVDVINASELGTRNAPAAPCTARKPTTSSTVGARAMAVEATANPTRPTRSTRARPSESLTEPATRISEPSVTR